jgi:predicted DNA-binding transcriptional regulator YafY
MPWRRNKMLELKMGKYIEFDYVNWKGINGHRKVEVYKIYWGSNEYHKKEQWLLEAFDIDKKEYREFAMSDMSNVKETQY